MELKLNPYFILRDDLGSGISTVDGTQASFTDSQRYRLAELQAAPRTFAPSDLPLVEAGAAIPSAALPQLREAMLDTVAATLRKTASLVLMPTEKCNFRCTYCYEKFEKGRASQAVQSGIKRYLEREVPQHENYQLAWFGGEPLLQADIVEDITTHFSALKAAAGVSGSTSITTNGYLLNSGLVEKLAAAGLDVYHITLDGPKEIHDRQRIPVNGRPTYERIVANIRLVLEQSGSRVVLRVNVFLGQEAAVDGIGAWLRDELLPQLQDYRERIDYYIVPVWDATTTSIDGICLSRLLDFQRLARLKETALQIKGSSLLDELSAFLGKSGSLACYAGSPNSYVIGADGTVYKCTVAVDLPENRVGRLLADGSMELDHARAALWTGNNALSDQTCGSCAFARACQGIFCPLVRLQTHKPPCPTEKRFAKDIVNRNY